MTDDPTILPTADEIPPILTAKQATRLLHVRPATVLQWIRTGALRAADVSSTPGHGRARWRILRTDLLAFLDGRQPAPPPERERRRRPRKPEKWVEFVRTDA